MTDQPIRVLLVDDHELIRTGLSGVFELEADMTIAGVAATVSEAIASFDTLAPDVVVTDLSCRTAPASTWCARCASRAPPSGWSC